MPKTALTVVPTARSPERDRLAGTIAERARVADLVRAREVKHQEEADRGLDIRSEIYRLEDDLKRPRLQHEHDREAALLRGEEPAVPTVASIKAEIAGLQAQAADSREVVGRLAQDCALLRNRLHMAEMGVQDAILDVVAAEVDRATLITLHARLTRQGLLLARAIEGATRVQRIGDPPPADIGNAICLSTLPACPWAAAVARLNTDPDVPLPSIEAALALADIVPGEPSFPDAA